MVKTINYAFHDTNNFFYRRKSGVYCLFCKHHLTSPCSSFNFNVPRCAFSLSVFCSIFTQIASNVDKVLLQAFQTSSCFSKIHRRILQLSVDSVQFYPRVVFQNSSEAVKLKFNTLDRHLPRHFWFQQSLIGLLTYFPAARPVSQVLPI